ncbi:hypothetical protein DLR62_04655 [Vibrio tarriae]|nr:hypothetical protein DLR62_04655 [Vibrio tarriae]
MVSASFGHFKSPLGRRFDLIIRARRLECGFYDALTFNVCSPPSSSTAIFRLIGSPSNGKLHMLAQRVVVIRGGDNNVAETVDVVLTHSLCFL